MKILWISQNVPYPPKTGVLQRNYNLIREASQIGEVTLVAILKEDILPGEFDLDEALKELGKFCHKIEIIRLPIESSSLRLYWTALGSLFTRDPFSVNWVKCRKMATKLRKLTTETSFDVIHFDTISLATYCDIGKDVGKILNHHNIESHLLQRRTLVEKNYLKKSFYALEGRKLRRFEANVCPKFDINFTVSELDKARLLDLAPGARADVIANGVDIDYFCPQPSSRTGSQSVIIVSGMNWFPNRDAVIYMCDQIWPKLVEAYPTLSWVVVGSSPPQQLLKLAAEDQRVIVTGFVDDVRTYIAEADVYLCPMRDGGGTRLKILDALAMAKPIVATTMAYEGISVTPEHNVLVADSPDEFVTQIGRLLNDKELCRKLGAEARRFAIDYYSWPVIGKQLEKNYKWIACSKGKQEKC